MSPSTIVLAAGDPLYAHGLGWAVLLIVLIKILVSFAVCMVAVMLMIWFERKVISDMQSRIGPNRAGPWGLLQSLADGIKLFFKAVAACVPMGILMYFTRHSNAVFGAIAAGLPLYLIACWKLKCLDMQYLLSMREMFSRRSKA